jgi:hypothetical protein
MYTWHVCATAAAADLVPLVRVSPRLAQLLLQLTDVGAPGSHVQGVRHLLLMQRHNTGGGAVWAPFVKCSVTGTVVQLVDCV